jgi:hypothetical protein
MVNLIHRYWKIPSLWTLQKETTMRVLLKATMNIESGNRASRQGNLSSTIQSILEEQKPESAYFVASQGQRTALLFLDIQDVSQIPALAEPWFLAFNADVEVTPAMTPQDLAKAAPSIEKAVKKFGSLATSAAAR